MIAHGPWYGEFHHLPEMFRLLPFVVPTVLAWAAWWRRR